MGERPRAVEAVELSPGFWRGRRVLVTGHTGFKGSWLALWLSSLGAEVTGYARGVPTAPALYDEGRVADTLQAALTGDVADLERLVGAVAERRPEVVFHLAAQPLVLRGYEDPTGTFATNVMGTVHVLEAVRRAGGVRVVVNVTTDKVYEDRGGERGYREDEPKGGADPYASSKACSELVTEAYRASFFSGADGPAVATARAGNVIGGGDWAADRLVPDLVRAALDGHVAPLRRPDAVRPWQHVLNPLHGYLLLAERMWADPGLATGWNFGPADDDARPVRWIAERMADLWDGRLRWEAHPPPPDRHEAAALRLDSARARERLGWVPRWDLGEGLRRTVEWFRARERGEDPRTVTLEQIAAFQGRG